MQAKALVWYVISSGKEGWQDYVQLVQEFLHCIITVAPEQLQCKYAVMASQM